MDSCTNCSVSLSSEDVASSRTTMGAFFNKHRAMATRCFSPPLNFNPLSPTIVSNPCGSRRINSSSLVSLTTSSTEESTFHTSDEVAVFFS
mmetsp:Transcript_34317/g.49871  ORF Transcript_34317/g.49871 Transcript_34317/m.49871 type:complete len:91 (+) Transcript_34317:210-482(+)